jgi:hypothetical protein
VVVMVWWWDLQQYVIKFVSYLRQVGGFHPGPPASSTNITDHHDITEILLNIFNEVQ